MGMKQSDSNENSIRFSQGEFGYDNVNQAPKVEKIVVSVGTGRVDDKQKIALIQDRMAKITGQKAAPRRIINQLHH